MSTNLKPCPFCGSVAIVWMQAGHAHYLECSHCGGRIRPHIDKAEAIEAWNRRAERTAKVEEAVPHMTILKRKVDLLSILQAIKLV